MRPANLAPTVFSTVGLTAERRVELWETHNETALIGLRVYAAEPLDATELNVQLPQVHLARVSGSAHVVARSTEVISRTPADAVAIYMTLRGDAWFSHKHGTRVLRPGDVLVCETDRPFRRGFTRGLEELVVKVPLAAVASRADVARRPAVATFDMDDQYARALAKVTGRATRTVRPLPADEGTVLDLVAVLTGGRTTAQAAAHRAAARCYVEEHLTNPVLGADRIAAAIGISERHLSRVFAADGISVPRHILVRRLQLAYSLLSGPHGANETIADVATRCGFTSVTYFSRVFRYHFGMRAGEVRRGARRSA